jgi:hypothetical protein
VAEVNSWTRLATQIKLSSCYRTQRSINIDSLCTRDRNKFGAKSKARKCRFFPLQDLILSMKPVYLLGPTFPQPWLRRMQCSGMLRLVFTEVSEEPALRSGCSAHLRPWRWRQYVPPANFRCTTRRHISDDSFQTNFFFSVVACHVDAQIILTVSTSRGWCLSISSSRFKYCAPLWTLWRLVRRYSRRNKPNKIS